jgi:hypothetical protein
MAEANEHPDIPVGKRSRLENFKHQWGNGGRIIIFSVAFAFFVFGVFVTTGLALLFYPEDKFEPITDVQAPQLIGKAVPTEPVTFATYACIKESVTLDIAFSFSDFTPPGQPTPKPEDDLGLVPGPNPITNVTASSGCRLSPITFALPMSLTPGYWRLILSVTAKAHGETQEITILSQPFVVGSK